jgi:hypothetical protein
LKESFEKGETVVRVLEKLKAEPGAENKHELF